MFTYRCFFFYRPFRVLAESSVLPVGGSTQVTLEFKPEKVGDHQKDLVLKYDTGKLPKIIRLMLVISYFLVVCACNMVV